MLGNPSKTEPAARALRLRVLPATAGRWGDVERLFGPRGACAGCWCQFWRLPRGQFDAGKGAANRRALRRQVRMGPPPGLLAYAGKEPVGWCALGPRASYPGLARSRVLKPVDAAPVWSVTCLFVARAWRNRGVSVALVDAAARFARRSGARLIEGYPVDPARRQADAFVWTGLASAFRQAGYGEVARRSPTRPIVRRRLV